MARAELAPKGLEEGLKKMGAVAHRLTAYRTVIPKTGSAEIRRIRARLLRGEVDFITFTSASTVSHFVKMVGLAAARKIAWKTRWASIGPVTSRAIRSFGLKPACQAKTYTVDGLIKAMRGSR